MYTGELHNSKSTKLKMTKYILEDIITSNIYV